MNFNGCENGYATDEWLVLRAINETRACETRYVAFKAVAGIFLLQESFLVILAALSLKRSIIPSQARLFSFALANSVPKVVLILLSLRNPDFGSSSAWIWLLFSAYIVTFALFAIEGFQKMSEISGNVQYQFKVKGFSADLSKNLSTKLIFNYLIMSGILMTLMLVSCWVVMLSVADQATEVDWPKQGEKVTDINEFWFRLGCGTLALCLLIASVLALLRLNVLITFIHVFVPNGNSEVKLFATKMKRMRLTTVPGAFLGAIIWSAHAFYLRMYWFMVFFHFTLAAIAQWTMMYVYHRFDFLESLNPTRV